MTPLSGARIVVAVTAPSSASFYAGQLCALRNAGAEVYFVASPSREVADQCAAEGATFIEIAMARAPSPARDARALACMTAALRRIRPDLVNAGTPKAGLLGMLAAAALRVPVRIHTLHGLRYEAAVGATRKMLWAAQRASCAAATHVVCVSSSLRSRAVETRLLRAGDGIVVGDGSVNGVDTEVFHPGARHAPRPFTAGYLGRLAGDKGIGDLALAWQRLTGRGWRLVIAGEIDETDPPKSDALDALNRMGDVSFLGQVRDPVAFHDDIDVLLLPSRREGFPTVALEAAAMERPVVATLATGCVDAVVAGETGLLVPIGDAGALAAAIERYARTPELRRQHGRTARARVTERYSRARVHALTIALYRSLLR